MLFLGLGLTTSALEDWCALCDNEAQFQRWKGAFRMSEIWRIQIPRIEIFTSAGSYCFTAFSILPIYDVLQYIGTITSMPTNMQRSLVCFYLLLQSHAIFSLPSRPLNNPPLTLIQPSPASNISKPTYLPYPPHPPHRTTHTDSRFPQL